MSRLRAICLGFPEVTERLSHGSPAFFVRGRKTFVMALPNGHHDADFPHLWCAAPPGAQAELVEAEPDRYFRPPYVGGRGWLGLRLDVDVDDDELAALCEEAYRCVAPATLLKRLDDPTSG